MPKRILGSALARSHEVDGGESSEVAVERGHGAPVLEGDRSDHRIGNEITGGVPLVADPAEQLEVPRPRLEA
jgi:hypothetical protein